MVVYHGTPGDTKITKIDYSKSDDKISFFTTNDKNHTASSYSEIPNTGNEHIDNTIMMYEEAGEPVDYDIIKQYYEESLRDDE